MVEQSKTFLSNVNLAARQMLGRAGLTFSGSRDLYEVLGYKRELDSKDYRDRYEKGDIAQSIVDAFPNGAWACPPMPTDDKDSKEDSPWEIAFRAWAKENKLWQTIRKADILAQLNEFSIILFGIVGDTDLEEPLVGRKQIAYLKPYGADTACVDKWEEDPTNARFGKPLTYKIQIEATPGSTSTKSITVHFSRVLHIAERTLEKDHLGIPFLKPIWNVLDDLEKVRGGSAEVFWINARAGLNLNIDPEFDMPDPEAVKENVDQYQHNLSRVLYTKGIDVKTLSQAVASPKDAAELYLTIISAYTRIPRRILEGSERGALSSDQDENNFNSRLKERQSLFCEPEVLEPLMQMMFSLGVIATAEYVWEWPELVTLSEKDKTDIATGKANAIKTFSDAVNANALVTDKQFVEDIMGMEYLENEVEESLDAEDAEIKESKDALPSNA